MTTPSAASIIQNSGLLRSHTLADYVHNISHDDHHDHSHISATTTTTWDPPLIDLHSPLAHKSMAAACRDWGFFQLQNHGLSRQVLDGLRSHAHSLFELPLAQKEKAACCNATNFFGYGVVKARTYFPNAWMEGFDMEWTPDSRVRQHAERLGLRGDELKSFCGVVEDYATGAEKLAVQLTELVAEGLGIKSTTFSQHFEESSTSTVRMNYYPPCPQPSKTLGILPHSDFNIFTILLQDTVPGLQVLKDNEWITVQPSQDVLVVNVGDAFQAWSNTRVKSVMHRALVNPNVPRLSVVYFFGPRPETLIVPPPELVDSEYPMKYRTFVYKEMVEKIFKVRGKPTFESPLQSFLL